MSTATRAPRRVRTAASAVALAGSLLGTLAAAPSYAAGSAPQLPAPFHTEAAQAVTAVKAGKAAKAGTGELSSKMLTARTVLTSSSDKSLTLSVSGISAGKDSTVTVGLAAGKESHSWTFPADADDVKVGRTGAGSIHLTSAQTGGLGKLDLEFDPDGRTKKTFCDDRLALKRRAMSVAGIAFFDTGTAAWGSVGKKKRSISFNRSSQTMWVYDVSCEEGRSQRCFSSLDWSASDFGGKTITTLSGHSNGTTARVDGMRMVQLTAPQGAYRMDMRSVRRTPLPTFSGTRSSAAVDVALGEGSLRLEGTNGQSTSTPCEDTHQMVDTTWFASVANGTEPLSVPAEIFGSFGVGDDAFGSFTRTVVS